MKQKIWIAFFGILISMVCQATVLPQSLSGTFKTLPALNNLPSKDVQSIYQDRDGYIWISTRNGLFQYDGYSITSYKSNLYRPDLLTNNNIFCTAEDADHHLWIGTYSGLNVLDKRTGVIRKLDKPEMVGNGVSAIAVTRDNRIWLGTERGLYEYLADRDSCLLYELENTNNILPYTTIKSLFEDDRGDIWIGTWDKGLYRYEYSTGKFIKYPQMNSGNSAHVIFQDSNKNIWIGTWGAGLQLLHNAYEPSKVSWTTFTHDENHTASISDNLIYAIFEDINNHTLWVGTRSGLSVLPLNQNYTSASSFNNYYSDETDRSITSSEVASLMRDRQGILWIGMIGGGVNMVNTRKPDFYLDPLTDAKQSLKTNSVRSMMVDDEGLLWLGISTYGFGVKDRKTGKFTHFTQMPEFASYKGVSSVMSILQSPTTHHIWLGVYNGGVYEYNKKAPVGQRVRLYNAENTPWLTNSCVYHIFEDSRRDLWFATRAGISMRLADGTALRFDSLQVVDNVIMKDVVAMQIAEGNKGEMWVASNTHGIIRIQGHGSKLSGYKLSSYSSSNGKLNGNYANCVYKDIDGRIWVGTGSNGLNLYDEVNDTFLSVHATWNLPGDVVNSILGDMNGNLWLGTNVGLVKLSVPLDFEHISFRLYTTADGLQDNIFVRGSSTATLDGELLFGGHRGYNSFYPAKQKDQDFSTPAVITDIKIFNQSWDKLQGGEREEVSLLSPGFTDEVRLDYRHNNFSIEFSALEYANPERNRYAYKLEGFDADWQYADAAKRFAYYNNLKPGTYTFYLKASNSNGIWNDETRKLQVVILPPPWRTWWAYTIYIVCFLAVAYYAYCLVRNRIRLRNALHLQEMEKAKVEEVNHAKLQFFTNITHELLTPLTILSASVDEMKQMAPGYKDQYKVMANNINRLIRLLQQILEFRKAETGNLKLRVSESDLSQFVQRSIESFRPLMKKRDMQFSLSCSLHPFMAYFDPDKVDKILYNLLSNASKYNRPGGMVGVELSGEIEGFARLVIKDNGPGISQEAQKNLFKRFYEGDYRKFKTIGTGIGLSLVRDLVLLHHGTITVESEEGQGTTFIVTFPILASSYEAEEIEVGGTTTEESNLPTSFVETAERDDTVISEFEDVEGENIITESQHTLLIVEDNEDLLQLMVKLLGTEYEIYTATNGKEALEVIEQEEIDLIVSDVMMPEMDGIELCQYIKNNIDTSHIPIILLTAKNKEEDRVEAYESGADGFISKPFNLSVLHARISNLLRSRLRIMKDFKKQLVFEAKDLNYTTLDEEFLQHAIECINRHLDDADYDQTRFLEEMHTTKSTCFRKLKSLTGLTYVSFIRNIRMKAACRIMEEKKNLRISDLAYAVGYNDARYFSSSFKKEFGMLPSEYMERFTTEGGTVEG
ncbi:two-component regulator propeller domain-containing protein [Bacteroides sp.]|uniref:hybrid sensor histidine kinase/response regulator transcription factor n=1 Tax=Bacteroides sp. TaxID=29523 RepID=UPI002615BCA8|nr:two-component regulator propeller domain-containing protein [Bacteroides sp.]